MGVKVDEFERAACKTLGLHYPKDETTGIHHNLGSFFIRESEEATRVVARKWLQVVNRFLSKLEDRGEHPEAMEKYRKAYLFYSYGEYLRKGREIDHDFADPTLRGYCWYVKKYNGRAWQLLSRKVPVLIPDNETRRHTYVVGTSGSGKSELLKLLVHSQLKTDCAIVVLDPHPDFARQIAAWPEAQDRLVYIEPRAQHMPVLNPFEFEGTEEERQIVAQEIASAFRQLLAAKDASISMNMEAVLIPCILTLLTRPGSDFSDLQRFMIDTGRGQAGLNGDLILLGQKYPRDHTRAFFENSWTNSHYTPSKMALATKVQALLNYSSFEHLTSGKSTIDLDALIQERKVILFNLSHLGDVKEAFGRLIMAMVQALTRRREERVPTHLFIDECQLFISESVETILTESRKFGLYLTMAQQNIGHGMSNQMRAIVINNTHLKFVGQTKESDRISAAAMIGADAKELSRLEPGQFFVKCGPLFKLHASDKLLGEKHGAKVWKESATYYRPINPEVTENGRMEVVSDQNEAEMVDEDIDLTKGGRW